MKGKSTKKDIIISVVFLLAAFVFAHWVGTCLFRGLGN